MSLLKCFTFGGEPDRSSVSALRRMGVVKRDATGGVCHWGGEVAGTSMKEGEVEGHRHLSVLDDVPLPGLCRDAEAEGRSEGTNDVDEWFQVTDGLEDI